ncbi:molybdopterin-binding protein [uncultured Parasphingorhabdus sp.]|uniref:molybdopterin-binding protein n=1 Tax=uncultured Parasphingorhabdus sp. TaxID=2709694 RepID=UPI0030DBDD37|tara:strand:+ start:25724 stop:26482 length:759 start_codon:yes stop_codon:yes gene_type:complete
MTIITRRKLISSAAIGAGSLLSGCDALNRSPAFQDILASAETANFTVQRALGDRMQLASEYGVADLSPKFRANGTRDPGTADYAASAAQGFGNWRLRLTGLFAKPQQFSLAALQSLPQRTQITRHDCVEGWSAIGKWTGVPLKILLDLAQLKSSAKFLVFHCADRLGGRPYYESIDLIDGFHPQTMLAYRLNGEPLPIENGAPLRLRVERQLGYKQAKYVTGVEAVASLAGIGEGKGGYWQDVANYEWYAGI